MERNNSLVSSKKLKDLHKTQKVIFLRVTPELHATLKTQAKGTGASVNKFLTKQIEEIGAAAMTRK